MGDVTLASFIVNFTVSGLAHLLLHVMEKRQDMKENAAI